MSSLAAVIIAHQDGEHLRRLAHALDDVPIFLHCDRRASRQVIEPAMVESGNRISLLPRTATTPASWALVEAELAGLSAAIRSTNAEHVAVLSGSDYPLVEMTQLGDELQGHRGQSLLQTQPLPLAAWGTKRHPDGGLWRSRTRFLTYNNRPLRISGVPLRSPFPRRIPAGLTLHASAQWKVLSRRHVRALFDALSDRPDLRTFWRSTFVPEESCIASILASSELVGGLAHSVHDALPWHMRWEPPGSPHPAWLKLEDLPEIVAAGRPDSSATPAKWFARKFGSPVDRKVLDEIDRQLRGVTESGHAVHAPRP